MSTPKKHQSSFNIISGAEYPGGPAARTGLRVYGNQNTSHLTHSNDAILSSAPAFPGHRGISIKKRPNESSGVSSSLGGDVIAPLSRPISAHTARHAHSDGVALSLSGIPSARTQGTHRDNQEPESARTSGIKTYSKGNSTSRDNPLSSSASDIPLPRASSITNHNRGSVSSRGAFNSSQLFAALAKQLDTTSLASSSFLSSVDTSNVEGSGSGLRRNTRRAREQCTLAFDKQPERPDEMFSVSDRMDVNHLKGKRRDKLGGGKGRKHVSTVCSSSVPYDMLAPPQQFADDDSTKIKTGKKHQTHNPTFASSVNLGTLNTSNTGMGTSVGVDTPIQTRKQARRNGAGAAMCLDLSLAEVDVADMYKQGKVEKKKGIRCISARTCVQTSAATGNDTDFNKLANSTADTSAFTMAFMNLGRSETPTTPIRTHTTRNAPFATTLSNIADEDGESGISNAANGRGDGNDSAGNRKNAKRKGNNTSNTLNTTRSFNPITGEGDVAAALPTCSGAGVSSRAVGERVERWWKGKRDNNTTAVTTTVTGKASESAGNDTLTTGNTSSTGAALRTPRVGEKHKSTSIGFDAFAAAFATAVNNKTF